MKILTIALENSKKSPPQHFTEKPILLKFKNLSAMFYPRLLPPLLDNKDPVWERSTLISVVFAQCYNFAEIASQKNKKIDNDTDFYRFITIPELTSLLRGDQTCFLRSFNPF